MNKTKLTQVILANHPIVLNNANGYGSCTFSNHPDIRVEWGDVFKEDYYDNRLVFESPGQGHGYIARTMKFFYQDELLGTELYLGVDGERYYIPFDSSFEISKERAEFYKLINHSSDLYEYSGTCIYISVLKRTGFKLVNDPWILGTFGQ